MSMRSICTLVCFPSVWPSITFSYWISKFSLADPGYLFSPRSTQTAAWVSHCCVTGNQGQRTLCCSVIKHFNSQGSNSVALKPRPPLIARWARGLSGKQTKKMECFFCRKVKQAMHPCFPPSFPPSYFLSLSFYLEN